MPLIVTVTHPSKCKRGRASSTRSIKFNGECRRIRKVGEAPIDILGAGGYVIAPPSVTGEGYVSFYRGRIRRFK